MKKNNTMQKLVIKGELVDLNSFLAAAYRSKFNAGRIKKKQTEQVYYLAKEQKLTKCTGAVSISFVWYCKDRKKDKDNVSSMGRKIILDGLVLAKIIKNDGWNNIIELHDEFEIDSVHPRVEIYIT